MQMLSHTVVVVRVIRALLLFSLIAFVSLISPSQLLADPDDFGLLVDGGSWQDAGTWTPAGPPGSFDIAYIGGGYPDGALNSGTVRLDADVDIYGVGTFDATLNLQGHKLSANTLEIAGPTIINRAGGSIDVDFLNVYDGVFAYQGNDFVGRATLNGPTSTLTLERDAPSTVVIKDGAELNLRNHNLQSALFDIEGAGTVTRELGGSLSLSEVDVRSGGSIVLQPLDHVLGLAKANGNGSMLTVSNKLQGSVEVSNGAVANLVGGIGPLGVYNFMTVDGGIVNASDTALLRNAFSPGSYSLTMSHGGELNMGDQLLDAGAVQLDPHATILHTADGRIRASEVDLYNTTLELHARDEIFGGASGGLSLYLASRVSVTQAPHVLTGLTLDDGRLFIEEGSRMDLLFDTSSAGPKWILALGGDHVADVQAWHAAGLLTWNVADSLVHIDEIGGVTYVSYNAVPEPSTFALAALGGLALLAWRRRG